MLMALVSPGAILAAAAEISTTTMAQYCVSALVTAEAAGGLRGFSCAAGTWVAGGAAIP